MCSIFGYTGRILPTDQINKGFQETLSRGPDMTKTLYFKQGMLGFHRLSIMGLSASGMQPFSLGSMSVVCNGEKDTFIAARDPIGIRPLYYGCDEGRTVSLLPRHDQSRQLLSRRSRNNQIIITFEEYVMSIDPEKKTNTYGKGKYLLRHAFDMNYLPKSILMREKAAFSDAVGHSLVDYLKFYVYKISSASLRSPAKFSINICL